MTTVKKVLDIAKKEIGYQEKPNNNTKYGEWYGVNYQPWCYMFVSWVLIKAGLDIEKCAYVPIGYEYFKKIKRLHSTPQPGDLAFFCWNKLRIPEHIGIVDKINSDNTFSCIEGNTSPTLTGSQNNGEGVYRKPRKFSDCLGFGRPFYSDEKYIFKDVKEGDLFSSEIQKCKEKGLIVGYPDGTLGVNDPLTMGRFLAIISKLL